ncbi:MAG: hypothetical protein WBD20_10150 [Pirellulaceae bacterium]
MSDTSFTRKSRERAELATESLSTQRRLTARAVMQKLQRWLMTPFAFHSRRATAHDIDTIRQMAEKLEMREQNRTIQA